MNQFAVGAAHNPTEVFRIGYGCNEPDARLGTVAFRVYDWSNDGQRSQHAHALALRIVAALDKDGLQ